MSEGMRDAPPPEAPPPAPAAARKSPSRESLLAVHQFPGEYVIKAFGPGHPEFHAAVVEAAHAEVHPTRVLVQVRTTTTNARQCVTLTLQAESVEEVEAVYERLHLLENLLLIL
jgi:putative lipoic acid-binding regulatory protein